tara:strand:- start:345 stop:836 length:492 start_codon:yes stop_codon:yes gene_type:complete
MNNQNAQSSIDSCLEELERINTLIENLLGHTSPIIPYLTKYAIVRACGTIEYCFKTIIADLHTGSPQVMNYIDSTIRSSSMNPSISNICSTLKKFDEDWNSSFTSKIRDHAHPQRLRDSIESLNNARNSFAHGGTPSSSFENVRDYFNDTVIIIEMLDEVVNE